MASIRDSRPTEVWSSSTGRRLSAVVSLAVRRASSRTNKEARSAAKSGDASFIVISTRPPSSSLVCRGQTLRVRQVDGLRVGPVLKRIVKRHRFGAGLGKDAAQARREDLVRKVIRPQAEHAPGTKMRRQSAKTVGLIEGVISRIEQELRRMIDVDEDRVELAGRRLRIEPRLGGGQLSL